MFVPTFVPSFFGIGELLRLGGTSEVFLPCRVVLVCADMALLSAAAFRLSYFSRKNSQVVLLSSFHDDPDFCAVLEVGRHWPTVNCSKARTGSAVYRHRPPAWLGVV